MKSLEAWRLIMGLKHEPVALILSRQALPTLDRTKYGPASGVRRGAYVLSEAANGQPDVLLLATGSEVSLCISAQAELAKHGIHARVVSMPSWKLFRGSRRGLSGIGPSLRRPRPRLRRTGRTLRLGTLRRN